MCTQTKYFQEKQIWSILLQTHNWPFDLDKTNPSQMAVGQIKCSSEYCNSTYQYKSSFWFNKSMLHLLSQINIILVTDIDVSTSLHLSTEYYYIVSGTPMQSTVWTEASVFKISLKNPHNLKSYHRLVKEPLYFN